MSQKEKGRKGENMEEKKYESPMEILDKLRKAMEPLGYEIVGFDFLGNAITIKIVQA